MRILLKELHQFTTTKPFDDIIIEYNDDNISVIDAIINGPYSTPFENGQFRIRMNISIDYPITPPRCYFITKIYHPNVNITTGEICVNTLKKDWNSTYGIVHILQVIRCLLIQPNPESALNEEAGKLLLDNYDDYSKRAALMTKIHAKIQIDITQRLKQNTDDNSSNNNNSNTNNTSTDKENSSSQQQTTTVNKPTVTEKPKINAAAKKNLKRL